MVIKKGDYVSIKFWKRNDDMERGNCGTVVIKGGRGTLDETTILPEMFMPCNKARK